jgi:hypothetical protein
MIIDFVEIEMMSVIARISYLEHVREQESF